MEIASRFLLSCWKCHVKGWKQSKLPWNESYSETSDNGSTPGAPVEGTGTPTGICIRSTHANRWYPSLIPLLVHIGSYLRWSSSDGWGLPEPTEAADWHLPSRKRWGLPCKSGRSLGSRHWHSESSAAGRNDPMLLFPNRIKAWFFQRVAFLYTRGIL